VLVTVSTVNYKLVLNDLENYTVKLDRYLNMNNHDFCQQSLNKQKEIDGLLLKPDIQNEYTIHLFYTQRKRDGVVFMRFWSHFVLKNSGN
jgi:hypothetical protein